VTSLNFTEDTPSAWVASAVFSVVVVGATLSVSVAMGVLHDRITSINPPISITRDNFFLFMSPPFQGQALNRKVDDVMGKDYL
jgi:hypothetical protein